MIKYRILPEHRLIAICNWGETSIEEINTFSLNLRSDPNYSYDHDAIVDNSLSTTTFSNNEIYMLAKYRKDPRAVKIKIAIIAPTDLSYGISRMHGALSESENPYNINIFRDMNSAIEWLDRSELDIERIFEEIKKVPH